MKLNPDIALLRQVDGSDLPTEFYTTELMAKLKASLESYRESDGELTMRYEIPESQSNGFGVVHGGIITTVLDQTMINALFFADRNLLGTSTISMSVNFIGLLKPGPTMVKARPVFTGNRVSQLSAECYGAQENQKLVATATSSTLLRR